MDIDTDIDIDTDRYRHIHPRFAKTNRELASSSSLVRFLPAATSLHFKN